jgi:hypothetical protein
MTGLSFILSFLVGPLQYSHCRFRWLLLHLVKINDTHTRTRAFGSTPLSEWLARSRVLYPHNTTFTTDKHPCPRRVSNPQSQQATGLKPTLPRCQRDGHESELSWPTCRKFIFCLFRQEPALISVYCNVHMFRIKEIIHFGSLARLCNFLT